MIHRCCENQAILHFTFLADAQAPSGAVHRKHLQVLIASVRGSAGAISSALNILEC